jgi:formamidopyrimidine-DNA glycosylase
MSFSSLFLNQLSELITTNSSKHQIRERNQFIPKRLAMSIELPEAYILSRQMNNELHGKKIKSYELRDHENLQKLGFINKDTKPFDRLVNGKIELATSKGNVVLVKLDNEMNIVIAPEYGGRIRYFSSSKLTSNKFHLRMHFHDDTVLEVRLTGMGVIQAFKDKDLTQSYVYKRDFSGLPSPLDTESFSFERFSKSLNDQDISLKSALVGKDAITVGIGNSSFQDIIFRARIHPKKKTSALDHKEKHALYDAVRLVVEERIRQGGKKEFTDLYGKCGTYLPAMGPNMKDQVCATCGCSIQRLSIGGGQTYFCPSCQK